MNRRTAQGVLVGLLLAVPLMTIVVFAVQGGIRPRAPGVPTISPVLSVEERSKLVTYQRRCRKGEECEPPLGCLPDPRVFMAHCTDSECMTDAQCREGFTCQVLRTWGNSPRVRACIPLGVREAGQRCISIPVDREEACGSGLLCGASWCGLPCERERPEACPVGFFCADVTPGPLCLPTCEARGCPRGQECIHFHQGTSVCARIHGANCQQSPCPSGQECEVLQREDRPGEAWMACVIPCGKPGQAACPAGLVCEYNACQTPCDPKGPNTCEAGFRCGRFASEGPWVCRFDRHGDGPPFEAP